MTTATLAYRLRRLAESAAQRLVRWIADRSHASGPDSTLPFIWLPGPEIAPVVLVAAMSYEHFAQRRQDAQSDEAVS